MKKVVLFLAMAMTLTFVGCEEKDSGMDIIDARLKFVGTYTLNISSDVSITNGINTAKYDMSATNKTLKIELDPSNDSKLLVTGYYGAVSARVHDGRLCIDKYSGSVYTSGIYFFLTVTHGEASISGKTLSWISDVELAGIGSATLYGSGKLYNTAIR